MTRVKVAFENILKQRGLSDEKFVELVEGMYNLLGSLMFPDKDITYAECKVVDGKIECSIEESVYVALPIDAAYLAVRNGMKGRKKITKDLEMKVRWFTGT